MPLQILFRHTWTSRWVALCLFSGSGDLLREERESICSLFKRALTEPKLSIVLRGREVGNWTDLSCIQLSPHTCCFLYLEPLSPTSLCGSLMPLLQANKGCHGEPALRWEGPFGRVDAQGGWCPEPKGPFHLLGFTNVTSHRVKNWQLFFHKSFQTQLRDPFCRSHLSGLTMMVCSFGSDTHCCANAKLWLQLWGDR